MKIKKIELENFGRFGNFSYEIPQRRVVVVSGRNGSGKSTLFVESLIWLFYGDTWKDVSADNVIADGKDFCKVKVELENGDTIEREKFRKKGSVVKYNGIILDNNFTEMVKIGKSAFLNSVAFCSGLSGFLNLSESERKEVIAEYVSSDVNDVISKLAKEIKEKENEKRSLTEKRKEIQTLKSSMEERLKGIDELGNVEEISNLRIKIESEKEKIKELKSNIEKLENEINDKKTKVTEITKEISGIRDQERSKIRVLGGIEKELRDRKDKIREINSLVECPTCLQEIGDEHKSSVSKRLENEITEIEKELKNVNVELENIRAEIKSREDKIWSVENEVKELSIVLNDLIKMRFSVENEIESISYQIQNLENNKKMRDWVSSEIEKLTEQENRVVSDLNILEEEVLAENWWIERLTRYKAEIMDRIIDKFSQIVNEFLYRLTNRFSVKMNYKVSGTKRIGEKLVLTILDRGQEIEWKRLSNGERRLVALALNLCFNYVSSKILASDWNLLIFDEVFDGLDNVVRERVVDLMLDLVNDMQKGIIIVSHEDISYKEESLEKLRLEV